MSDMELPDSVPTMDEVESKREEIENLYDSVGMATSYQDHYFDAVEVVTGEGCSPDSRLGGHMINLMLQERVNDLLNDLNEQASDL